MRPRSQRVVAGNGVGARPGLIAVAGGGSAGSCAADRHQARTGQSPHRGVRGRQTVAPRSIRACVHVAGSPVRDHAVGDDLHVARRHRLPRHPRHATEDAAHIDVDRPDTLTERDRRDRPSRVRTDARQRLEGFDRVRGRDRRARRG